ncbi:short-chain dehydrogenase [Puia sp.]|jgi:hypothetical protein|uniref:short-chain dehydrogenase n=1 Tax=Puia sp. TaxID=2045100 RepID=UPI002F408E9B
MTIEQIEKFIGGGEDVKQQANIFFKTRGTVEGVFIKTADYSELKKKNFWRIVSVKHIAEFRKSNDINLSRIFNGAEFTKLSQKG